MIIKKRHYYCKRCKESQFFEFGKPYESSCPICGEQMEFCAILDCDPELAEQVRNAPAYDPTKDPKSPYYIPVIECPYCHSTKTKKISTMSKVAHTAVFGIYGMGRNSKEWHCNSCGSDF